MKTSVILAGESLQCIIHSREDMVAVRNSRLATDWFPNFRYSFASPKSVLERKGLDSYGKRGMIETPQE
ncbi:hypothetical protein AF331_08955 [Rossellomorea marisflavi]|uniref:Uncharacterized protein n=1 Tax=Rossellomorea marisflavi TaxID=189381 RepID=A0A0M0GRI3_9BACI|nr:hypothetical protein AF331_08955 [Rossellomorea marisflavi]